MEAPIKLFFTVATVLVGIAVAFGSDGFVSLPKWHSYYNWTNRPDGSLRKYTRVVMLSWFALALAIMWFLL